MKRVLTFATASLFVTGLALTPLAANAQQAVSGKDGKPVATTSAVTPSTGTTAAAPVAKTDDHKVTTGSTAATPAATTKTPAKSGS